MTLIYSATTERFLAFITSPMIRERRDMRAFVTEMTSPCNVEISYYAWEDVAAFTLISRILKCREWVIGHICCLLDVFHSLLRFSFLRLFIEHAAQTAWRFKIELAWTRMPPALDGGACDGQSGDHWHHTILVYFGRLPHCRSLFSALKWIAKYCRLSIFSHPIVN